MAASVVNHYIGEVKDGELTLEEAKKEALDKVATLRYDNGNYVWINDYNSVMIMHPVSKALVGKDLSDFTDKNGTKIFSEFTKAAKNRITSYNVCYTKLLRNSLSLSSPGLPHT